MEVFKVRDDTFVHADEALITNISSGKPIHTDIHFNQCIAWLCDLAGLRSNIDDSLWWRNLRRSLLEQLRAELAAERREIHEQQRQQLQQDLPFAVKSTSQCVDFGYGIVGSCFCDKGSH